MAGKSITPIPQDYCMWLIIPRSKAQLGIVMDHDPNVSSHDGMILN
jgi:hypothetical protein